MRRRSHETGSALVFVLWIALLIALLAAGASIAVRGRIIETRVENTVMRETAALRSGLEIAAWTIALEGRTGVQRLPVTVPVGDYLVRVSLSDTHNRIDVNMADETALMRVFAAVGASEAVGRRLTDQILDWRDPDQRARPFGAEAPAYADVRSKSIGDRPFRSVAELTQVLSLTRPQLDCIRPYVTLFGGSGPNQGAPLNGLEPPPGADGMRVAFTARLVNPDGAPGRELDALALFGAAQSRPYEWQRFGDDDGALPVCDPGVFR